MSAGSCFTSGAFGKLEDQLCALTPDFDRRAAGFSPDRADALVWALADLLGVDGRGGDADYGAGCVEAVGLRRAVAVTSRAADRGAT